MIVAIDLFFVARAGCGSITPQAMSKPREQPVGFEHPAQLHQRARQIATQCNANALISRSKLGGRNGISSGSPATRGPAAGANQSAEGSA